MEKEVKYHDSHGRRPGGGGDGGPALYQTRKKEEIKLLSVLVGKEVARLERIFWLTSLILAAALIFFLLAGWFTIQSKLLS